MWHFLSKIGNQFLKSFWCTKSGSSTIFFVLELLEPLEPFEKFSFWENCSFKKMGFSKKTFWNPVARQGARVSRTTGTLCKIVLRLSTILSARGSTLSPSLYARVYVLQLFKGWHLSTFAAWRTRSSRTDVLRVTLLTYSRPPTAVGGRETTRRFLNV